MRKFYADVRFRLTLTGSGMGLIARNALALLGSQAASWLVALLLLVVVPQHLGDQQFGQYSFATTFVGFFSIFASLGGGTFITKQTARNPALLGLYVYNALLMGLVVVTLLSVTAIGAAYVLGYPAVICTLVAIECTNMILTTLSAPLNAGLQGQQRMKWMAIWAVAGRYVVGATVVVALVTRRGLYGVALAGSLGPISSLLGNGAQLAREVRKGARLDFHLWKVLVLGGTPFLLWSLVSTCYGSIDILLLSKMTNDAVVGWYALAYRLVALPIFLPTIVVTALFPQLSTLGAYASPSFASLVNRAVMVVFFACAPMAAGVALVAGDLISFLHYPAGFTRSVPLIQILALHIPVVGITTLLGTALMACDRQRRWVVVGIVAAAFNPLLNLFAIPATTNAFGNGAIGASIITVATELLMLGGAAYLLRPYGVLDRQTIGYVFRCVVACAAMVAIVLACHSIWFPARISVGVLAYCLASLALGTLPARELQRRYLQIVTLAHPSSAQSTT